MRIALLVTIIFFSLIGPSSIYAQENTYSISLERDDAYFLNISDSAQSSLDLEGDNTLEAWVKIESFGERDLFIINKADPYSSDSSYYLFVNGQGKIEGRYSSDGSLVQGSNIRYVSESLFPMNEWVHISVTFDISAQEVNLYLNGEDVQVNVFGSIGSSIHDSDQDFMIGARMVNTVMSHFDGKIDEVRVWDRLRTQAEILGDMTKELSGNEPGLVGYWQFDGNYRDSSHSINDLLAQGLIEYDEDVPFAGVSVEDNVYPLYTQGTSTHPSLEETLSWANEPYADGNVWGCKYIATCGCAITSLVMGARYHGQDEDVLGNDVNPLNINSYLTGVPGGYSDGAVNWWATQVYLGELDSEGRASSRFHYLTSVDQTTMDTYIDEEHLVLGFRSADSQINRPHFVWLPEKTTSSYVVRDPFWYNTETGDDVENLLGNVRDYNNSFTSGRVYEVYDELVQLGSGVEAYVRGTAELLFRSTAGEVGYFDGSVTIDLDQSRYGTPDVVTIAADTPEDSRYLLVPSSGNLFSIDVIGTDTGSFEFSVFATSDDGMVRTFELEGYTIPGLVTTFIFDLSDGTATESPITYEQFLGIMDSLLGDMTPQQRSFFERWAKKIFEDMEEKTVTQAIQSIETFGKLLVAKKLDNLVMTSVLEKLQTQVE